MHSMHLKLSLKLANRGVTMTHAIGLSTFGDSSNKINTIKAYYGSFRNKINLRWVVGTFNYSLQMKTQCDYGKPLITCCK